MPQTECGLGSSFHSSTVAEQTLPVSKTRSIEFRRMLSSKGDRGFVDEKNNLGQNSVSG
jgi:hypothetical protein